MHLSRRGLLQSLSLAGLSLSLTPSWAATPSDSRLVVILLRGAMDGLYLVQPYGDPAFAALRPSLAAMPGHGLIDLDGHFGLHEAAADLSPLWKTDELAFVHGVATPYRGERSHFVGQDILELGALKATKSTGWLNSALAALPIARKAIDIGETKELIFSGTAPVDVWYPGSGRALPGDELEFYARLYAGDPAFAAAFQQASLLRGGDSDASGTVQASAISAFVAGMLLKDYRVASFSIYGWDNHISQAQQFKRPIRELCDAITTLKSRLGNKWADTTVLVVTEFGRTARENGSGGTDHGTGGCCLVAGGNVGWAKNRTHWPGLATDKLLEARDLQPTTDVREVMAAAVYRQYGIPVSRLTTDIFPGLEFDKNSRFLNA